MSLRKITKNRGSFPSDEALMKPFYLALRIISEKWAEPDPEISASPITDSLAQPQAA